MATELPIDSSSALADQFYSLFNISKPIENDPQRPHPKFATYCHKFSSSTSAENGTVKRLQEKRRREMLDNLKSKRQKLVDSFRPIIAYIQNDEIEAISDSPPRNTCAVEKVQKSPICNDSVMKEVKATGRRTNKKNDDTSMQVDDQSSPTQKGRRTRYNHSRQWRLKNEKEFRKLISKQLMLSEWLVDVPTDFYTYWYMVFCPRGKRTLVIAANGQTRIYSRTGYFMFQFQSLLPGGCQTSSSKNSIIDCIYVEEEHTFFVLDVISWNGCDFLDCDTEFRFFWLQSRFADEFASLSQMSSPPAECSSASSKNCDVEMLDEVQEKTLTKGLPKLFHNNSPIANQLNKPSVCKLFNFMPLTFLECTVENIKQRAKGPYQFNTEIDGILFFHKRAPYTAGITPLVCWLKVHMIPNILNICLN